MKKGQGLSVNVIIVAVLALLVLVVVAFIFTGKFGQFSKATANCESIAGNVCEYSCESGYVVDNTRSCYDDDNDPTGEVCCIPVS
jgi:hypothetical protein